MGQRANQVVRLLEDLRRLTISPEDEIASEAGEASAATSSVAEQQQQRQGQGQQSEDHRPPKRPWEDMSDSATSPDASALAAVSGSDFEAHGPSLATSEKRVRQGVLTVVFS